MSNKLPEDWRRCPKKGELINLELYGKFLPFKTPLDEKFNQLEEDELFTPKMFIKSQEDVNQKIGLWIDLTNTNRYYNRREVENAGIKYHKLICDGHKGAPTFKKVNLFIKICKKFFSKTPSAVICVHCTHGFNRTGFLICSYLIKELNWDVDTAINQFISSREPGIYKQEYLNELYKRYANGKEPCKASLKPNWCVKNLKNDSNQLSSSSQSVYKKQTKNSSSCFIKNSFIGSIPGVEFVNNLEKVRALQDQIRKFCYFNKDGFPGSQPVPMCNDNMFLISRRPHLVSYFEAVRCMMLINDENEIYLFDGNNTVFQVVESCLKFPRRNKPDEHLKNTLLDGEMAIDSFHYSKIPIYLIHDIIKIDGKDVSGMSFDIRTTCIEKEIVLAREEAKKSGLVNYDLESFAIRKKDYYDLEMTEKLFTQNFSNDHASNSKSLIFQPINEAYKAGKFSNILKWKPPGYSSIDFRIKIFNTEVKGLEVEIKAALLVNNGRKEENFSIIPATKEFIKNDGKIVECTYDYQLKIWKLIRVKTDKSYPNSCFTAMTIYEKMRNPLNKEKLIDYIKENLSKNKSKKRSYPIN